MWHSVSTARLLLASGLVTCIPRAAAFNESTYEHAVSLMKSSPLIDTHMDLPQILRSLSRNPLDMVSRVAERLPGHADIPRMRQGHLSGVFWTVWAPCPDILGPEQDQGPDFLKPTNHVRDALEELDMIQNLIERNSEHLQFAHSSGDIMKAFNSGKIATLIAMEGTHLLGNSLAVLRVFARMGLRYITLTHTCHSAFASSNGPGGPMIPAHEGNGLTELGEELIREMNRLGIVIDLSHVSDPTAKRAIALSKAPVVWTHSGSRTLWDHPRNVPDDILQMIGDGPGKNPGVVFSVFYPPFIGPTPETANLTRVADHIEYVASIVGRKHVGIGSDFDGMYAAVQGLEDATKYPNLVAEMVHRGWSDDEIKDLMGRNLLRVLDEVDQVQASLNDTLPSSAIWEKRKDLPAAWGGPNNWYYPYEVREARAEMGIVHDEL
ncbi:membrane dipeptidase [Thozetella sp. PMI_491]|nr:membrane dipeptidase [Thozetella sp. PMI_491]